MRPLPFWECYSGFSPILYALCNYILICVWPTWPHKSGKFSCTYASEFLAFVEQRDKVAAVVPQCEPGRK
jgi:hypothetical protein